MGHGAEVGATALENVPIGSVQLTVFAVAAPASNASVSVHEAAATILHEPAAPDRGAILAAIVVPVHAWHRNALHCGELVPPPVPRQVHVHGPVPARFPGWPAEHRFWLGVFGIAVLFVVPQTPFAKGT